LPAIFAALQPRHARLSASLDPDDPNSSYFDPDVRLAATTPSGAAHPVQHVRAAE